MHKHVIFSKTVNELVTILKKCFFPYLNPKSYLKSHTQILMHNTHWGQYTDTTI